MPRGVQGAVLRLLRAPEHVLAVTEVRELPPYTEVTVRCPTLLGTSAATLPPTTWVRMWIPEGGREHQRAYTLTRVDRATATARILFLHHTPSGPASRWARTAEPGDTVPVQLLGGTGYRPPREDDSVLLVGDGASAPAVAAALSHAPAGCQTQVVLAAKAGHLPPGVSPGTGSHTLTLVDPGGGQERVLAAVSEVLADAGTPRWAWVAMGSGTTRAVRSRLLSAGVPRRSIQHQAYWVQGKAMGTSGPAQPG